MAAGRGRHLPKRLERPEVTRLLAAMAPTSKSGRWSPTLLRNRVALEVLHRSALRVSEACDLEVGDVVERPDGLWLHVRHGKGDRERWVPVDPQLERWVRAWMERKPVGRALLCTLEGGPLSPRFLQQLVQRAAKKAEVENTTERPVTPHVLRHTRASEWLEDGLTVAEVKQLLGHSDRTDTSIYLHASPQALAAKVRGCVTLPQDATPLPPAPTPAQGDELAALRAQVAALTDLVSQLVKQ